MRHLFAHVIWIALSRLSLPTLLQCLLSRAVRSLLLMRSSTDATELFSGTELHISACCPNQAILWTKKHQKTQLVFLLNSGLSTEKKFYRENLITLLPTEVLLWKGTVWWEPRAPRSSRAPWKKFQTSKNRSASDFRFNSGAENSGADKLVLVNLCTECLIWSISRCIFEYLLSNSRASSVSTLCGRCRLCSWQEARRQGCPVGERWQCHCTLKTSVWTPCGLQWWCRDVFNVSFAWQGRPWEWWNGTLWYSQFCKFDMFRDFVKNSNSMCDVALSMWLLFSLFLPFSVQNEDESRLSEDTENEVTWEPI